MNKYLAVVDIWLVIHRRLHASEPGTTAGAGIVVLGISYVYFCPENNWKPTRV
ncbi:MAG: hypothetical protein IPO61_02605 [Gammaproteobacteria bacterium]|nr:hypothetical protein [Gammaproteobacteria bacterium]